MKKHFTLISIILIIILGAAVYANSLSGKFVWDDHLLIGDNVYIESWANLPKIFTSGITAGARVIENSFYRPLQIVTYLINYSLWGLNPGGYHLTNIILHIIVAICIYQFVNLLFSDSALALLTGIFFVVHPVHTEAVTYISGRADSLSAIFLLFCLIYYIRTVHIESPKAYFFISLSYTAALLSKENSLILPLILLFYHYAFRVKINIKKISLISSITIIYIILRFVVFRNFMPEIENKGSFLQTVPGFFAAITSYVRLLFVPFDLHMEYGNRLFSFTHPAVISGALITVSSLAVAFIKRKNNKILFFGVGWFFIMFIPVANIYRVNSSYMMEHWLYLPSIGFFLICSMALRFLYRKKNFQAQTVIITIALLAFYSYLTIKQNDYWSDEVTFYERTLKYKPTNPKIYFNLGLVYENNGRKQNAINAYKKALELNPNYFLAHNNLAVAYYEEKKYDLAIKHCDKALELGYQVHPEFLELLKPYRKSLGQNK